MTKIIVLLVVGALLVSSVAQAQVREEPVIEWTDSLRLALAQGFVAESGPRTRTEHAVLAHMLERTWRAYRRNNSRSTWSFEAKVRRFIAMHRTREATPRQDCLKDLPWGPLTAVRQDCRRWMPSPESWDYTRETVALFEAGGLSDPLPQAEDMGGAMDGPAVGAVLLTRVVRDVDTGERVTLHNRFYSIDDAAVRAYRIARRAAAARPVPVPGSVVPAAVAMGGFNGS